MKPMTALFIAGAAALTALSPASNSARAFGLEDLGHATGSPGGKQGDSQKETRGDSRQDAHHDSVYKLGLPPYTGPKKRLAVMELDSRYSTITTNEPTATGGETSETTINIPPPSDFGPGLTEMLTTALIQSNRFILLERKSVSDIQTEQALNSGGAFDPAAATKPGGLLGAQALVRGAITEYSFKKSSVGGSGAFAKALHIAHGSATASLTLDIRLYDTTTGRIIDSVAARGEAKTSGTAADFSVGDVKMGGSGFDETPLAHATREAIINAVRQICDRMEKLPWEGRVADVDSDGDKVAAIYINAGSGAGIKPGDEFEILHPGRTIVDPETRVVIGRTRDKRAGRCRVDSVTAGLAIAQPVDGDGFQKDDVVRFASAAGLLPAEPSAAAGPAQSTPPQKP